MALGFMVAFFVGGDWFFVCRAGLLLVLGFLVGGGGGGVGDLLGDGVDAASPSNTLSSYRAL